jgi:hypothetical protein
LEAQHKLLGARNLLELILETGVFRSDPEHCFLAGFFLLYWFGLHFLFDHFFGFDFFVYFGFLLFSGLGHFLGSFSL